MSNYRRARVPGATYFFTVNLRDRRSDLLAREVDLLRATVRATHARHPFHIDAWVVLPEHMHCIWTLPAGDLDFAGRWRIIKAAFSRRLSGHGTPNTTQAARGERGIWQRRYWEHLDPGREGLPASSALLLFQPGEARSGGERRGLAVLDVSSRHDDRLRTDRLGIHRGRIRGT